MITTSAVAKLIPKPPALVESMNRNFSLKNATLKLNKRLSKPILRRYLSPHLHRDARRLKMPHETSQEFPFIP